MKNTLKKIISIVLSFVICLGIFASPITVSAAASKPTFNVKGVTNITSTDAQLNVTISNPSNSRIVQVGFILYDSKGNRLTQNCDTLNQTWGVINASFSMQKYWGKLKPSTTYQYEFYVLVGATLRLYISPRNTFTTSAYTYTTSDLDWIIPLLIPTSNATLRNYANNVRNFINDPRFTNGITWNSSQRPKVSRWSSTGCCAYVNDFITYVYGSTSVYSNDFTKYTTLNSIKTGDIVHFYYKDKNGNDKQHWMVVIYRDGQNLYTAEGNRGGHVVIKLGYRIMNGKLYIVDNSNTLMNVTSVEVYHHK